MRYFCTYFDQNYLARGLALYDSLVAHAGEFELTVLCMDEACESALRQKAAPEIRTLRISELTEKYPQLAAARTDRTPLEFYFTCTSWLMQHLVSQISAGELLTYLDADLYFFSSPQPIYDEIGGASVAITPHRFPPSLAHLDRYGKFNVGWVSLRNNSTGRACAADWAKKCADWCFNRLEGDRYADQKYLDRWPVDFPGTVCLRQSGINAAPWNIKDCVINGHSDRPLINGEPLIFYHFHALHPIGRQLFDPSLHKYDAVLFPQLRVLIYLPYLRQLLAHGDSPGETPEILPPADPADPRNSIALRTVLGNLQASELDRAKRLIGIDEIKADRDLARADLDKNTAYLNAVERDSAERLASIHFYQDKLQTAYSDLERNVAYIKTLESEIAAHLKVSADKDAIISTLHAQLQAALSTRPASP